MAHTTLKAGGRLVILDSDDESDSGSFIEVPPPRRNRLKFPTLDDALSSSSEEDASIADKLGRLSLHGTPCEYSVFSSSSGESVESIPKAEGIQNEALIFSPYKKDPNSAWGLVGDEYMLVKKHPDIIWPKTRIPKALFHQLYAYQAVGVQWIASLHTNGIGGILGDSMGLGKTFMTLAYLGGLMRAKTISNALVVAPMSVLRSWENEAEKVLRAAVHNVKILVISSTQRNRDSIIREAMRCSNDKPHLIVTTYGLIQSSVKSFVPDEKEFWDYVILDEGHKIKNHTSQTALSCRSICRCPKTHRLMLTGTPIMNRLKELWSVFDWATSGRVLGKNKNFTNYFAKPIEDARDKNASERVIRLGEAVNSELQCKLKPYFLQRLKEEVLADVLPPKEEIVLWTHISQKQRSMYESYVDGDNSVVKMILTGMISSPLEAITALKKICGHPFLFDKNFTNNTFDVREAIKQSPKLEVLTALVLNFRSNGHRALIFSQSTRMLDIIQKVLEYSSIKLLRIDGQTKEKDRQRFVDKFNNTACSVDAMLLSTKAAGVGLTLTGADRVVIFDPSWTPAEDAQAVDRCYRIGQKRDVVAYRMIAAGTVEEKMYEKQIHKEGIRRAVFTENCEIDRYFDKHELQKVFKLSPPGVCEVMNKVQEESERHGIKTDWKEHDFVLEFPGVVGLSRHDGFYFTASALDSGLPTFDGNTPGKKSLGDSCHVVDLTDDITENPKAVKESFGKSERNFFNTEQKENIPSPLIGMVIDFDPNGEVESYSDNSSGSSRTGSRLLAKGLDQLANGYRKCALGIFLDTQEKFLHELSANEKLKLHEAIVTTASSLGLP